MQTRDQRYATAVYEQVSVVPADDREKYESLAHGLPVLIRTAGLAQALAFVKTRKENAARLLLKHLANVVIDAAPEKLLERSRTLSLLEYMRLTREILAALVWYRRLSEAVFESDAPPPPSPEQTLVAAAPAGGAL